TKSFSRSRWVSQRYCCRHKHKFFFPSFILSLLSFYLFFLRLVLFSVFFLLPLFHILLVSLFLLCVFALFCDRRRSAPLRSLSHAPLLPVLFWAFLCFVRLLACLFVCLFVCCKTCLIKCCCSRCFPACFHSVCPSVFLCFFV